MKLRLYLFIALFSQSFTVHAERVVIAGGTLTDIVFAIGAGDQVVAIDTSSTSPARAQSLPKVGYYRDLAAEGVLSQSPTLVLTLEGSGRPEVLTQLRSTGVRVTHYPKPTQVKELFALIERLGNDLNKQHNARALIRKLQQQLPDKAAPTHNKAMFILSASERGVLVAGTDTVPDILFGYTGIENLATEAGFKPYNIESLVSANPDFIVAPSHTVESLGGAEKFCQLPALALLSAAQECRLLVMDSLISIGMTSRLPEAIAQLSAFQREML
ncbi:MULTISPECIES: heme/hemin ABC transporter substrate-binding protein [Pseudoalteromonas]|uniref:Hemin ABC transporter substrate-binding protein n=1 Tax=Pseudoalteromonas amylolytica TaxID=1859457 RepID=A0A1S1MRG4_9GAMM|nr:MULTISPECIES: ABC transporter substrate-binding protein [Pseudoalteromonas]MCF6435835.1 ABC transporter substrate-binding protein [Pseudoalteromonas sp. MMG022]OHU86651.1 hemin ABC transporter substrate-binding protein [Pseudoalteromonas sp. JW3]OHU88825.1 hemin ABC transporter substrate-binding protein [Pseudoalteromonas amylolytica]